MGGTSFTFLHAADLHIDSPLRGLVRYPGAPAERLRNATRDAFENLISQALEREVGFVIVAGDVFDGDWKDFNSGLWFTAQVRRLASAGIPLVLLRGNHDAESRVTKSLRHPKGVTEFPSSAPATIHIDGLEVALHGQSFADAHVSENLMRGYPAPLPDVFNIGVLHTALEGYEGHARYAPCTAADLRAKGYDYWALGHVHKREIVSREPWIVFPGNLQGRHARELGPKSATLVTVTGGRVSATTTIECDVARWANVELDLGETDTEEALMREAEVQLGRALGEADERLLAARITLTGVTPLDTVLRADPLRFESEVRNLGLSLSNELWIERVCIETRRARRGQRADDGFGALAERIRQATLDPVEAGAIANDLTRLADRLPPRLTATIQPKDRATILAATEAARRYLAALLDSDTHARGASDA